jgi:hypothetical protein
MTDLLVAGPAYGSTPMIMEDLRLHRDAVIETALVDCGVGDRERAEQGLDAFAQWFFTLPTLEPGQRLIMLKGPVDQMWHALILHTKLYRELCEQHLGFFLDHQPQPDYPPRAWVADTLRILTRRFGDALHPLFDDWLPAEMLGPSPYQREIL